MTPSDVLLRRLMGAGLFTCRPSWGAAGGGAAGRRLKGCRSVLAGTWHLAVRAVGRGFGVLGLEAWRPPCRVPSIG